MIINKFPYQKISRKTINGVRLYSCPNGDKLPSVTTILSITTPKEKQIALENWRKRVGHQKAATITREAACRGTSMHSFLEFYMKNGELDKPNEQSIQSFDMANQIIKFSLSNVKEFYGTEIGLYYPELYAGTADTIYLQDDEIILGDFKQSNKVKNKEWIDSYFMQLAAYIEAHDTVYNTQIKKGKIMMCTPMLEYQQWIIEGTELQKYKDLWWERVYQYYDKILGG